MDSYQHCMFIVFMLEKCCCTSGFKLILFRLRALLLCHSNWYAFHWVTYWLSSRFLGKRSRRTINMNVIKELAVQI